MKKIKWLGKEVYLLSKEEMENLMGKRLVTKKKKATRRVKYEWGEEYTTTYVFNGDTIFTHTVTPLIIHEK